MTIYRITIYNLRHNMVSVHTYELVWTYDYRTLFVQNKKCVSIAYIDFTRAFDSVTHVKLLIRLHNYGIRGHLLHWLAVFFTGRCTYQTRLGLCLSDVAELLSGVVQGVTLDLADCLSVMVYCPIVCWWCQSYLELRRSSGNARITEGSSYNRYAG